MAKDIKFEADARSGLAAGGEQQEQKGQRKNSGFLHRDISFYIFLRSYGILP